MLVRPGFTLSVAMALHRSRIASRGMVLCLFALAVAAPAATLTSVTVTPVKAILYPGESEQYGATCHYSNRADDDCTAAGGVKWVVTNPNGLASVNSSGHLVASTHGTSGGGTVSSTSFVEARVNGSAIYGYSYLAVLPAAGDSVASVAVSPTSTSGETLPAGATMWVSAQITTANGTAIHTPRTVTWTSSDPSVATVDWEGHVTAVGPGTSTLTATARGSSKSLTLKVIAATPNPSLRVWYVRADGGSRYDAADNPTGRCDGLSDLPDPGKGSNQPCAYSNPKWLWIASATTNKIRWAISGGDTVIIRQNPNGTGNTPSGICNNGPYDCGYDVGAKDWAHFASPGFDGCAGLQYSCMNPPIPSGTPALHTRILGENFASCGATSAKTTLYGTVANNAVLNLSNTSYVDVACIGVSDRTGCLRFGNAGQDVCQPGVDPRPSITGIMVDPATTNISLTDVDVHGVSSGWLGMAGDNITLTRARFAGNSSAGMNFDPGNGYTQGGGIRADHLKVEWNGCAEQYPAASPFPYDNCNGQNTGGYGDGVGTPDTGGVWSIDHSTFRYNTQDGLDLLHVSLPGGSSFSVTNSIAYANMGQQFKLGMSNEVIFRNNQVIGDCSRMAWPVAGTPSGFNSEFYLPITAASWSGGTVTVTIGTNSPPWYGGGTLQVGQSAVVVGATPSAYNGTFTITAVTATTVSYALASNPGTYAGGGIWTGSDSCRANGTAVAISVTPHSVFHIQNNTWTGPDNIHLEIECALDASIGDCTGAQIYLQNNIMRGYYSIGRKSYSTGLYMGNGAKLGPIFTGTRDHNLFYNLKTGAETDCNKGYPREICADPEFVGELHDSVWQTSNDQTLWDHADLRLSSKSPALYSGTTIPAITEDFAGTPRPQFSTYDIGAFEFTGSNPPIIQTGFLPDATAGSAYRTTLEATGDTPISWSIAAGALPAWATLDPSTGVITGRPNAAGKTAFTVRARSHAGAVEAPFTLTISAMPPRQPAARR